MNHNFFKINDSIQYCDYFLNLEIIRRLHDKIYYSNSWGRQTSSEGEKNFFWICNLNLDDPVITEEVKHIQSLVPKKIIRTYVNGQTAFQHGNFHIDDGDKTHLLGLSKDWSYEDGGATEFLDNNSTSFLVYPLFNRLTIFDAKILHRSLPHTNKNKFRMTLAIKTEE